MTDHLTENARLRVALRACINMLDDLVAESGRGIEYGEEDAFRMGEWFDDHDLGQIDTARAALATPATDAVQDAAELAALLDKSDSQMIRLMTAVHAALKWDIEKGYAMPTDIHGELIAALRAIAGDRT